MTLMLDLEMEYPVWNIGHRHQMVILIYKSLFDIIKTRVCKEDYEQTTTIFPITYDNGKGQIVNVT